MKWPSRWCVIQSFKFSALLSVALGNNVTVTTYDNLASIYILCLLTFIYITKGHTKLSFTFCLTCQIWTNCTINLFNSTNAVFSFVWGHCLAMMKYLPVQWKYMSLSLLCLLHQTWVNYISLSPLAIFSWCIFHNYFEVMHHSVITESHPMQAFACIDNYNM